jgi:hypothetical protein
VLVLVIIGIINGMPILEKYLFVVS